MKALKNESGAIVYKNVDSVKSTRTCWMSVALAGLGHSSGGCCVILLHSELAEPWIGSAVGCIFAVWGQELQKQTLACHVCLQTMVKNM